MAETFSLSELVIPGTYIDVRAEGLISVGGIAYGNIGLVGTAKPENEGDALPTGTVILSSYAEAVAAFGRYSVLDDPDVADDKPVSLVRGAELAYQNGARIVMARALAADADQTAYEQAFTELLKDEVNILVAPELDTATARAVMAGVLEAAENDGKDLIAVIGCDATTVEEIGAQSLAATNDRIIMVTPGIKAFDSAEYRRLVEKKKADPKVDPKTGAKVVLGGNWAAAPVAGLLASLSPESSPTNKPLPSVLGLQQRFSYGNIKTLVGKRALVLEERNGVRVVRGLTTDDGAFTQITTRRITDYAKAGIRRASNPFIGRLNNQRVRAALRGAIDGFLTTMVQDEALTGYTVEVTATRQDEIAGRAMVNAVIQPTFSIDFIAVTMVLE